MLFQTYMTFFHGEGEDFERSTGPCSWGLHGAVRLQKGHKMYKLYHAFELVFDILQVLYVFIFMLLADL